MQNNPSALEEAIEALRDSLADLEGEHEVMCGRPIDRDQWSLDVKVVHIDAILDALAARQESPCVPVAPILIDEDNLAVAIAECFLCQPKDMAWEDRSGQLAKAVVDFLVPRALANGGGDAE